MSAVDRFTGKFSVNRLIELKPKMVAKMAALLKK